MTQGFGDSGLPPGCRPADLERGVSPLDDLSPPQLWMLLDERRQSALYREFFRREWAELSVCLDGREESVAQVRVLWLAWRNTALRRMALAGQIRQPQK